MPDPSSTDWLTLTDFSGGIRQMVNASSIQAFSPQPVGVAAAVDTTGNSATFNCIALPGGGIGPLPFEFQILTTGIANPDGNQAAMVGGLHVPQFSELYANAVANSYNFPTDLSSVFVSINYLFSSIGSVQRYRLYRLDTFKNNNMQEINNPAGAAPFYDTINPVPNTSGFYGGYTPMCDYRSSGAGLPTTPGDPYVIVGVCDPSTLGTVVYQYPRPGFTNRVGSYVAIKQPVHLISHQGRLLVNGADRTFTLGPNTLVHNDDNYWTIPNQDTYDNGGASSSFSQAVVGAYGTIASASSSELLLIRLHSQGGIVVASDLNDPIITDYSGIQGTNGCHVDGCWTPLGYVYGAKYGSVYVYPGGGKSVDIAPELESGFWHEDIDNSNYHVGQSIDTLNIGYPARNQTWPLVEHLGKFAYHDNFIFCPGNWVYDINANSWWRFKTPVNGGGEETFHKWFASSPGGVVYSSPHTYNAAAAPLDPLICAANFNNGGPDSWQFTSQLIPIAKESEINEVRELIIEGLPSNGTGTIAVTLTSYPNGQSVTKNFAITSTLTPQVFRTSIDPVIRGTHVSVKIVGSATDTNLNGPILMRMDLGLGKAVMVTKS